MYMSTNVIYENLKYTRVLVCNNPFFKPALPPIWGHGAAGAYPATAGRGWRTCWTECQTMTGFE